MAESLRCKFEEHLTCSVCLEPFKDPKVLPCLHSYCHECIVRLTKNAESNTINCPECRLSVEVRKMVIVKLLIELIEKLNVKICKCPEINDAFGAIYMSGYSWDKSWEKSLLLVSSRLAQPEDDKIFSGVFFVLNLYLH